MISVIVAYTKGDKTRQESFKIFMDCVNKQTYKDFELIIVEMLFDEPSEIVWEGIKHITLDYKYIPALESIYHLFNKSWCINVGVRNAVSNNLLIIDADLQFEKDYFQRIVDFSKNAPKFFVCYENIIWSKGRDNPNERIVRGLHLHTAGGSWFIDKDFFWEIGGMDESFFGYGGEDNEFWERARHILKTITYMQGKITHTYHHWHNGRFALGSHRNRILNSTERNVPEAIKRLKEVQLGGSFPRPTYKL